MGFQHNIRDCLSLITVTTAEWKQTAINICKEEAYNTMHTPTNEGALQGINIPKVYTLKRCITFDLFSAVRIPVYQVHTIIPRIIPTNYRGIQYIHSRTVLYTKYYAKFHVGFRALNCAFILVKIHILL